jgi:hypothetical protein
MANLIKLSTVEKEIAIDDINKNLVYRKVFTPTNQPSNYFALFYKDSGVAIWNTKSGLLSNDFTIVKTEEVFNDIKTNLNSQETYRKDSSWDTFSKIDFVLNGVSTLTLNSTNDEKLNMLMFKLLTNINPDTVNSETKLSFTLVNAFGGEHTLYIAYGLLTNFIIKKKDGTSENSSLNNLIILSKYGKRLIHNETMTLKFSDVADIKTKIQERIDKFKAVKFDADIVKKFEEKFTKKFFNQIMAIVSAVPVDYHNLFYVSYILSHITSTAKNINAIVTCGKVLNELIEE